MKIKFQCTNNSCGIELTVDKRVINPVNPKVRCSKCKQIIDLGEIIKGKIVQNQESQLQKDTEDSLAWLIVHDEKTSKQSFALKSGKYIVGRKNESKPCDVMIDCSNDPYMSRNHCTIEVRPNLRGNLEVILSDNQSTNGTWLNAENKIGLKPGEKVFLEDNDMLQLGMTKVIVKIKQGKILNTDAAAAEVFSRPFGKTRIID